MKNEIKMIKKYIFRYCHDFHILIIRKHVHVCDANKT